jgi:hypothetical protein
MKDDFNGFVYTEFKFHWCHCYNDSLWQDGNVQKDNFTDQFVQ